MTGRIDLLCLGDGAMIHPQDHIPVMTTTVCNTRKEWSTIQSTTEGVVNLCGQINGRCTDGVVNQLI